MGVAYIVVSLKRQTTLFYKMLNVIASCNLLIDFEYSKVSKGTVPIRSFA